MKYKCKQCSDTGWIRTERDTYVECSCLTISRIRKSWTRYGVKPEFVKTLEDYVPHNKISFLLKQKANSYVNNFSNIAGEENNWFAILGQAGSGKSHVALAVGASLINRAINPIKTVYMPYLEVMKELKANVMNEESYLKILARYEEAELLIIDDLFKDKIKQNKVVYDLKDSDINHIYPIINYRYLNKLPTIISSECNPNLLLSLDEAVAGRILERCNDNIIIFSGEENDYRLRKFK